MKYASNISIEYYRSSAAVLVVFLCVPVLVRPSLAALRCLCCALQPIATMLMFIFVLFIPVRGAPADSAVYRSKYFFLPVVGQVFFRVVFSRTHARAHTHKSEECCAFVFGFLVRKLLFAVCVLSAISCIDSGHTPVRSDLFEYVCSVLAAWQLLFSSFPFSLFFCPHFSFEMQMPAIDFRVNRRVFTFTVADVPR